MLNKNPYLLCTFSGSDYKVIKYPNRLLTYHGENLISLVIKISNHWEGQILRVLLISHIVFFNVDIYF